MGPIHAKYGHCSMFHLGWSHNPSIFLGGATSSKLRGAGGGEGEDMEEEEVDASLFVLNLFC